jgi:glycosyltransferase involved in cell wall biosynthesis
MQVTFVSAWYPFPTDNGAKMRALAIIRALAREHCVDLVVLNTGETAMHDPEPLRHLCRSITTISVPMFSPQSGSRWRSLFRATPRSFVTTYNPTVTALLERRIAARECDVVICGELAAYYGLKVARSVAVFIDDVDPSRYEDAVRSASSVRSRLRAVLTDWKYRGFVRTLDAECAGLFVTSQREATLIHAITAHTARIAIIPNGVTLTEEPDRPPRDAHRLVYSGSPTYGPNRDAIAFFAADILPRIRARMPDAWLAVTGKTDGVPLDTLAVTPGVAFTGWLPDIRAYVAASRVCVVPLRQGGGTRLKILEAMALGTPVVATTKGAEGLDLTNGEDILIADDPAAFADATVRLLTDDALHARIAARARATAARYDWEIIGTELLAALIRLSDAWAMRSDVRGDARNATDRGRATIANPLVPD